MWKLQPPSTAPQSVLRTKEPDMQITKLLLLFKRKPALVFPPIVWPSAQGAGRLPSRSPNPKQRRVQSEMSKIANALIRLGTSGPVTWAYNWYSRCNLAFLEREFADKEPRLRNVLPWPVKSSETSRSATPHTSSGCLLHTSQDQPELSACPSSTSDLPGAAAPETQPAKSSTQGGRL
jgi:hypothetical protein